MLRSQPIYFYIILPSFACKISSTKRLPTLGNMRDLHSLWRHKKKTLLIILLLLYICYEKTLNQQCNNTWTSSASLLNEEIYNELNKYEHTVLIASAPSNYARRSSIRNSWMNLAKDKVIEISHDTRIHNRTSKKVKFYFVVGTGGLETHDKLQIDIEKKEFNDMLLFEFVDSYSALTTKMLLSIRWINHNMKGLKYLIKCDDDAFLRIDQILHNLEEYAPAMNAPEISKYVSPQEHPQYKGLYWGYFNGQARVFKSGKWKERKWFLCDRYLPYALGGAYVISRNIVDFIARNADDLSQYNSEDVSMGVWTSPLDGINRVHDLRFDTSAQSRGCSDDMLVRHKISANKMTEIYMTLKNTQGKQLCSSEGVTKYYVYDWSAAPSMCCKAGKGQ